LFVFARAYRAAEPVLAGRGYRLIRLPGPFEGRAAVAQAVEKLRRTLGRTR
jgi:hypothetical protein